MKAEEYLAAKRDEYSSRKQGMTAEEYLGIDTPSDRQPASRSAPLPDQMRDAGGGTVQDDAAYAMRRQPRAAAMPDIGGRTGAVAGPTRDEIVPPSAPAASTRTPEMPTDQPRIVQRDPSTGEVLEGAGKGLLSGVVQGASLAPVEPGMGGSIVARWLYENRDDPTFQGANVAGNLAGYMVPFGAASKAVKAGMRAPQIARSLAKAGTIGRTGLRGAAEGALVAGAKEGGATVTGQGFDPRRVGEEAALFAGGDILLRGAGNVAKNLYKRAKAASFGKKATQTAEDYLQATGQQPVPEAMRAQRQALEMIEGRKALPAPKRTAPASTVDIPEGKVKPTPAPSTKPGTTDASKIDSPSKALSITGPLVGFEQDQDGSINYNVTVGLMGLAGTAGLGAVARSPLMRSRMKQTLQTTKNVVKGIGRKVPDHAYVSSPAEAKATTWVRRSGLQSSVPPLEKGEWKTVLEQYDPTSWKDIKTPMTQVRDLWRNAEKVMGEDNPVYRMTVNSFEKAKGGYIDDFVRIEDQHSQALKVFGMKPGSRKVKAVMEFGEGRRSREKLVEEFGEKGAAEIEAMDRWYRRMYDQLLDKANKSLRAIYPDQELFVARRDGQFLGAFDTKKAAERAVAEFGTGDKDAAYSISKEMINKHTIPRRENYYRHARETGEITGLVALFDTPTTISPTLEGVSAYTKPKSKWLSIAQKRLGAKGYEDDPSKAFVNYIQESLYAAHISPEIARLRSFNQALREATENSRNLNNFIRYVDQFANDLSGKTHQLDRGIQDVVGRRTFAVINWANQRVKANTILGNASSTMAQVLNLPQAIAATRGYSAIGAQDYLASIWRKHGPMAKSAFLKERYAPAKLMKYDTPMLFGDQRHLKKSAVWMIQKADEIATKWTWASFYRKGLAEGAENPSLYADRWTRKMVGGRGIGEPALLQKSKAFQMVAPFTLEVQNAWWALGDAVKRSSPTGKAAISAVPTFILASFLMNHGLEEVRGSSGSFDPMGALLDGLKKVDSDPRLDTAGKLLTVFGHLAGEVVSNVPGGQYVGGMVPNDLAEKYMGEHDPAKFSRFGGAGVPIGVLTRASQDPLPSLIPSFGGTQIKRTYEGIQAYRDGAVTKRNGDYMYDVPQTPESLLRVILFGKYSTPEARQYFEDQEYGQPPLQPIKGTGGRSINRGGSRGR